MLPMNKNITVDLQSIYNSLSGKEAKLSDIDLYVDDALKKAGEGNVVTLTGAAPIWMYLKIAHALHGKVKKLYYYAPGQAIDKFEIFSHDPY